MPTLLVVNEEITSGALSPPERRAWLILSSVTLATMLTWMLGCAFSKPATRAFTPAISPGALQACQKLIVVSLEASSLGPEDDWPVQAVVRRASEAEAARAVATFLDIPGMAGSPYGRAAAVVVVFAGRFAGRGVGRGVGLSGRCRRPRRGWPPARSPTRRAARGVRVRRRPRGAVGRRPAPPARPAPGRAAVRRRMVSEAPLSTTSSGSSTETSEARPVARPVAYVSRSRRCGPSLMRAACSTRAAATSA